MNATLEQTLYRSVVDEEFRALLAANPELFAFEGRECPRPVEAELHYGLAAVAMADIDVQACNNTCSWGMTVVCDKFTG